MIPIIKLFHALVRYPHANMLLSSSLSIFMVLRLILYLERIMAGHT